MSWTRTPARRVIGIAAVGMALLMLAYAFRSVGLLALSAALFLPAISVWSRRLASASIVWASLFVSLALAEWLIPIVHDFNASEPFDRTYAKGYYGRITDLGNQPPPGIYPSTSFTRNGSPIYRVTYRIGPDGFRVTPSPVKRPERYNFLGCSFTYGEGVEDNQTIPYFFAEDLGGVKVKNFTFHGYGAHQALRILQSRRDTAGSANIFITAPWHAPRSACKPDWTYGAPRYALAAGGGVVLAGACGIEREGGLAQKIINGLAAQSNVMKLIDQIRRGRIDDGDIALYVALVREMAKLSHARGQLFVLGYIKADKIFFKDTSYTSEKLYAELSRYADIHLDLTLAPTAEQIPRRYYLHELEHHPSVAANRQRAKLLADAIQRSAR